MNGLYRVGMGGASPERRPYTDRAEAEARRRARGSRLVNHAGSWEVVGRGLIETLTETSYNGRGVAAVQNRKAVDPCLPR